MIYIGCLQNFYPTVLISSDKCSLNNGRGSTPSNYQFLLGWYCSLYISGCSVLMANVFEGYVLIPWRSNLML